MRGPRSLQARLLLLLLLIVPAIWLVASAAAAWLARTRRWTSCSTPRWASSLGSCCWWMSATKR
ncbi:hypothetical protein JOS77_08110 [Chromobacterium haemolyticum]|nr:hypothetical protein JOS77_08110 [Chromobacterium haemolyticum]